MDLPFEPKAYQRWYDRDPALKRALEALRGAPDKHQAQVALNIIKVVVEHQLRADTGMEVEELYHSLLSGGVPAISLPTKVAFGHNRRWYDVNEALHSAMELLRDCPDELQKTLIPTISRMIEDTLTDD